jgi:hypothetical protein
LEGQISSSPSVWDRSTSTFRLFGFGDFLRHCVTVQAFTDSSKIRKIFIEPLGFLARVIILDFF